MRSLNVALQMDPIENIDIHTDTSFVLGLSAQQRSHQCWHYLPETLTWKNGCVSAYGHPIELKMNDNCWYVKGKAQRINLSHMDVILMRQDPPFDMSYITATHLLETIHPKTLVVNNPRSVRNAPEKLFIMEYIEFLPPTLISRDVLEINEFRRKHDSIIIKPLFGNGGQGIFHIQKDDSNLSSLLEMFFCNSREPVMVQKFISNVTQGDMRVILIDGKFAGAINRIPPKGQIRSNMHVGGIPLAAKADQRALEICEKLGPTLKKLGLILVGIDIIDGYLTEINVTSPTGIQEINRFDGVAIDCVFWDAIEEHYII